MVIASSVQVDDARYCVYVDPDYRLCFTDPGLADVYRVIRDPGGKWIRYGYDDGIAVGEAPINETIDLPIPPEPQCLLPECETIP